MAKNSALDSARVEFRMEPGLKSEVEEAAALLGLTLTAFASQTLVERARQIKKEATQIRLNDAERDAFIAALSNPPQPSEALRKTMNAKVDL